ncbi:MAG: hypothetical protein IJU31_02115, partial [Synergistaceae bacterium]|nr:hypothetical protein [Synergistaceae bacterium]
NLPQIFAVNQLAVLPITRGEYVISHFDAYHEFEENDSKQIIKCPLPSHLQSLCSDSITSEAMALNCALASGIIADFMEEEQIFATVVGRMGSGKFSFSIKDSQSNFSLPINVNNSQIEIDAGYEGVCCLALFEAKIDLAGDFLVRQLYYPFRAWQNRVSKPIKPIFFVYSNGIFRLFEYCFDDTYNYNSLRLIKQKNYSVEDSDISITDIQEILKHVRVIDEPEIPFPQADKFERVINICELLNSNELTRQDVTEVYDFTTRQTNYYTDAASYLGMIDKSQKDKQILYSLTDKGRRILNLNYKQRQLAYCESILSHKVFNDALRASLQKGSVLSVKEIIEIMKQSNPYKVESEETFKRRASTIRAWTLWIISLINE